MVNEQEIRFEINGIEASITVPRVIEPDDFDRWHQNLIANENEVPAEKVPNKILYERTALERLHLVKELDFPIGPTLQEMHAGARPLPTIAMAILKVTAPLIMDATDFPKLPGESTRS